MADDFVTYRRKLPHWRASGAIYFVTWRLEGAQPDLSAEERTVVVSALRHFDGRRYDLLAYVAMNDHIHVLVKPAPEHPLASILHTWKSYTARRFQRTCGRTRKIWQTESFDRIVRDDEELAEKMRYVVNNPLRRWPGTDNYPWAWSIGDQT